MKCIKELKKTGCAKLQITWIKVQITETLNIQQQSQAKRVSFIKHTNKIRMGFRAPIQHAK